jgi:hypothetical protein
MTSLSDSNIPNIIFPPETEWLIISNNAESHHTGYRLIFINKFYRLFVSCGLRNMSEINSENGLNLLFGTSHKRSEGAEIQFKGHFIFIKCDKEKLVIYNDHFGIQKFFYASHPFFIASNKIENILRFQKEIYQRRSALIRFALYNYFTDGQTIYDGINYSQPATKITLSNGGFQISKYWNGIISASDKQPDFTEKIKLISQLLLKILGEYSATLSESVSLTLTGGFDSRMILAGLMKLKININTFTFGNPQSSDAMNARKISEALKVPHATLSDVNYLRNNFKKIVDDSVTLSGGMLNLLRMNRIWHLKTGTNNNIFLGYAGSEILRGLYPDGLLQSGFFLNSVNPEIYLRKAICHTLDSRLIKYRSDEIDSITKDISSSTGSQYQIRHLLEVVIPLHFGEDMRWLELNGVKCFAPFLDVDLYELLALFGCVALLNHNKKFSGKSHYSRIDNPYLPSRIIKEIYTPLSELSLGKGYSPSDYIFSKYYAGVKLILNKYFSNSSPVTSLYPWYTDYLESYLNETSHDLLPIERLQARNYLANLKKHREVDLLPVTQLVNRLIIKNNFKPTFRVND